MSVPSFSSVLYDCATECALRRRKRRCKSYFGSMACKGCKFNVAEYGNFDPQQVKLFMLQAETRASALHTSSKSHRIFFLAAIIFCLWSGITSHIAYNRRAAQRADAVPQMVVVDDHDHVQATLNIVAEQLRRGIDVNRDGLINCIDAAVLFYQHYPYKDHVTISVNDNPRTGMHHLFNVVLINGIWRAIEPQAAFSGDRSYYMRDVWGSVYDASLNRTVTNQYKRYVR